MILCSPHNPVGRVWSKEELQQVADLRISMENGSSVMKFTAKSLIREGIHHIPLHTLVPEYKDEIIVCTAPSKSFNLAGLQNSNIIITKPEYQQRWKEFVGNRLSLNSCNSFALAATKAAYNESEDWLNQVDLILIRIFAMHVTIWKKSFRRLLFPPAKEPICCGWMSVRTVLTRGSSRSGCDSSL